MLRRDFLKVMAMSTFATSVPLISQNVLPAWMIIIDDPLSPGDVDTADMALWRSNFAYQYTRNRAIGQGF